VLGVVDPDTGGSRRGSLLEHVAPAALGLQCPLVGDVVGVPVDHGAGLPAVQPHQVTLGASGAQPVVAEGVPELVRRHARIASLLRPADEDRPEACDLQPSSVPGAESEPVGVGEPVETAGAQVDRQSTGRSRGERDNPPLASRSCPLQWHQVDQRVLHYVCRERVHHRPEEFCPTDTFAAQDADDGVVPGRLEVPCPASSGHFEEVLDKFCPQRLGAALDLGVAVQGIGIRGRVAALVLEEVEQLD